MPPKIQRLTTHEFRMVMKTGRAFSSHLFYLKILPNKLGHIRFGVGAAQKLAQRPAQKNYYKRILRGIIREAPFTEGVGVDIVLVAQKEARDTPHAQLKKEAEHILQKAKLI